MSSITEIFPSEIIHKTVSCLDSPSDVLSLGLSCKTLAEIAIPHHLNFRIFRVRSSRATEIWKFFTQAELTALEVRELYILAEKFGDVDYNISHVRWRWEAEPLVVPKALKKWGSEENIERPAFKKLREDEIELIEALKHMKMLKRFGWYRTPPPVIVEGEDIWTTLASLGTLEELDVVDFPFSRYKECPSEYRSVLGLSYVQTFLNIRGLKTLKMRTKYSRHDGLYPDPTNLIQMLVENRDLEKLHLHIEPRSVWLTSLFTNAHWDWLRVLDISGTVQCTPSPLLAFFRAHPLIEDLTLAPLMIGRRWFYKPLEIPSEPLLPNLRRLSSKFYQTVWLVEHGAGGEITELNGLDLTEDVFVDHISADSEDEEDEADEDNEVHDLLDLIISKNRVPSFRTIFFGMLNSNRLPSLTKIGFYKCDEASLSALANAAPFIREIQFLRTEDESYPNLVAVMTDYLPHLARFPQLKVLYSPDIVQSSHFIHKVAENCLSLERVVDEIDWQSQIVLLRDGGRIKWVYRVIGDNEAVAREGESVETSSDYALAD